MALPKIATPVFELKLPLSKKQIQFRPFLVKEQKNLLMAMESNDSDAIELNVKNVLRSCILTENIDVEKLPVVDIEFLFLNLRARSVGEVVENKYRCDNKIKDAEGNERSCGNIMQTSVNLLDIKVSNFTESDDTIDLGGNLHVKMKYPEFSIMSKLKSKNEANDIALAVVAESIDYIYDGEQFYYAKDSSQEELIEFVESMSQVQFAKIEKFFDELPKIEKTIELKCSRCGFEHKLEAEGLESFFG